MQTYPRTEQKSLSFHGEPLLRGRHRIHPYPAMLHPLLVNHLIDTYAGNGDVVFDPFCGSGVTLVQAGVNGYESVGFDLNPMALLITRAKTATYRRKKLLEEFNDLRNTVYESEISSPESCRIDVPPLRNRDYWYSADVVSDLVKIRHALKNRPYEYRDFFLACFALICRNQSFTRNGEFKRYRMNQEGIAKTKNEVLPRFFSHLHEMIEVFLEMDIPRTNSRPILANSENKIPSNIKYDLVVTSPPYGDSGTTVAYGQYTSFGSEWVNGLDIHNGKRQSYQIDRECLGKKGKLNEQLSEHTILTNTIEQISSIDRRRANEVLYFFNGYYNAVSNIVENLNDNGRVCFVVGNRTVKSIQIPMDQITSSFLDRLGLTFEQIYVREILNKVMPSRNSPSNQIGAKSKTMSNEYIVVFSNS